MATKTTEIQSGNSQSLANAFDALRDLAWPEEVLDQMKDQRPPEERDWNAVLESERISPNQKA